MRSLEFGIRSSELKIGSSQSLESLHTPHSALRTDLSPLPAPHSALRTGISLMEVLISIGIMAIGMVSIASLLPVGSVLVQRANIEERKAELGLNAFREFQIRGMGDTSNWVAHDTGNPPWRPYPPPSLSAAELRAVSTFAGRHRSADGLSLFLARQQSEDSNVSGQHADDRLPIDAAADNRRHREEECFWNYYFLSTDSGPSRCHFHIDRRSGGRSARRPHAAGHGSLRFNKLEARIRRQVFVAGHADARCHQHLGSHADEPIHALDRGLRPPPAGHTADGRQWARRILDDSRASLQRRIAHHANSRFNKHRRRRNDIHWHPMRKLALARPNNWMMLCQTNAAGSRAFSNGIESYRRSMDTPARPIVTLSGPDWVWGDSSHQTYACLFDGAVAVYQRVIHLDGPSVWNQ